jgi:hypothetical protein
MRLRDGQFIQDDDVGRSIGAVMVNDAFMTLFVRTEGDPSEFAPGRTAFLALVEIFTAGGRSPGSTFQTLIRSTS